MRKTLRIVGWSVGALVLFVAVAGAVIFAVSTSKLNRKYQVAVGPVEVSPDAGAIGRGAHLARTRGCMQCHGSDFGGARVIDDPAMGRIDGPNLTRGRGGLPVGVTNEELVRAIRHGVGRDGHGLFLMPSEDFAHFSNRDMGDLLAYIRSCTPVDRARGPVAPGPVARILLVLGKIHLAADVIDHAHLQPATAQPAVTVAYGRYVAASCTGCHGGNLSGGRIDIGPPDWPPARNLTPAGDLPGWSEADFLRTMRTHVRPDGSKLSDVMPAAFGQMNEVELQALWVYLKSLPASATGQH